MALPHLPRGGIRIKQQSHNAQKGTPPFPEMSLSVVSISPRQNRCPQYTVTCQLVTVDKSYRSRVASQ